MNYDIVTIECVLPFLPTRSNAYLFRTASNNILFDTGSRDDRSIETLLSAVEDFGGIDCIILSHGHLDHSGAAGTISAKLDVPVYASFDERDRLISDFDKRVERRLTNIIKVLEHLGFDSETTKKERDKIVYYRSYMAPVDFVFNASSFRDDELEIIQLPGHTAGSIGLYHKPSSSLFSGDALLKEGVSPFFDTDTMDNALARYLHSLDRIRELVPSSVYPGHGGPIRNVPVILDQHTGYVKRITADILKLAVEKQKSLIDIYKTLYPDRYNILIALAEIIYALESSGIGILQNLKDLLAE